MSQGLGRRAGVLALVVLVGTLGFASGAVAKAKAKGPGNGPAKVSLQVSKQTRGSLLLGGVIMAIRSDRAATVSLSVAGGLAEAEEATLDAAGGATVNLRLTDAGRAALTACGDQRRTFAVRAVFALTEKGRATTKQVQRSRSIAWSMPCS